ncbi:MAG: AAA family ATPase [Chloroflexi bacterium]|nr:AAA family ATPase [Chloroflexota bacterium]
MDMLQVKMLGEFDVRRDGAPILIPSRPAQSLLAFLLLTAGTPQRREKIAGLLWPNTSDENARSSLRHELWRLRKTLHAGPPRAPVENYLLTDELALAFNVNAPHWLDVAILKYTRADAPTNDLLAALALYRGELLPGFYEDWVVLEREQLYAIFEQKIARALERLLAEHRWQEILDWGERWIALGQSPEAAYRALMIAHSELGDRSRMAAVYQRCIESLRTDLGVEPSQETRALFEQLRVAEKKSHHVEVLTPRTLESERKQVTALFVDVPGFTAVGDQLDPEQIHQLMNRYFELIQTQVQRYEGAINQILGDRILAVFGAPRAYEDHAQRATLAALDIQRALADYQNQAREHWGIEFRVRMGLNTGLVLFGSIGDNPRLDYTATGDAVNLAFRMMSLAAPGQIVIAEDTFKMIGGLFETEFLGAKTLKGKTRPIKSYLVKRAHRRTRFDVVMERGLTPFVGHAKELTLLRDRFAEAKAGRGQIVFLMGDPGIGKSRLLIEFRRALESENLTWLTGRCISFGNSMAYLPHIDIAKQNFHITDEDDDATIRTKIERGTLALGEELRPHIPYFNYLLSANPVDQSILKMDAQARRLKIFDALRAVALKGAQVKPLVLIIEDLQWIDKTSEEVLLFLADSIVAARVLLILTYRTGYQNPFGERTYSTRLALAALSNDESIRLAEGALATRGLPVELRELVIRKAEGNPFFVEEVIKSLLETRALEKQNGSYALMKPLAAINVPDTIQDVIMARIDRLAHSPKRALQFASVIGREFAARLLDRISDLKTELDPSLHHLKTHELIYETSFFPELAYIFKHAMTHDVAYNSLPILRRKELHSGVGNAIEELYAERLPEYFETLGYHYEHGEAWIKALHFLFKAAQKAQQVYANRESLDHYARAVAICERLGETVEPETRIQVYAGKAAVHFILSEFRPAIDAYQRVLQLARQIHDREKEADALAQIGFCNFYLHDYQQSLEYATQAKTIATELGSQRVLATAWLVTGLLYAVTGKVVESKNDYEQALQFGESADAKPVQVITRHFLGMVYNWLGIYESSTQIHSRGVGIAQENNLPYPQLIVLWGSSVSAGSRGEYDRAIDCLRQGLALSARVGDKVFKCRMLNTLGWVYLELYALARAIQYNQEGVDLATVIKVAPELLRNAELNLGDAYLFLENWAQAQYWLEKVYRDSQERDKWGEVFMKWRYYQHACHSLGELRLNQGDVASAHALAAECLKIAEATASRKYIVKAKRLMSQVLLTENKYDPAEELLNHALALAQEIGNPPQLWKTWVALGELHARQGTAPRAREAYMNAWQVIDQIARRLHDQELAQIFLAARPVREIRQWVNL